MYILLRAIHISTFSGIGQLAIKVVAGALIYLIVISPFILNKKFQKNLL